MGQQSGFEDAYLKLSEEELLEGDSKHAGYVDIIDQLTIDESNKLKREVETLRVERKDVESIREEMRQEMNKQFEKIMSVIQQNPQLAQVKPEALTKKFEK